MKIEKQKTAKPDDDNPNNSHTKLGIFSLLTFLPCKIHLPSSKRFFMEYEGNKFQFLIAEKRRSLTIVDSENEFLTEKGTIKNKDFILSNPLKLIKDTVYNDDAIILGHEAGSMLYYMPYTLLIIDFETVKNNEMIHIAKRALEQFIYNYQISSRDMLAFTPTELFTHPIVDYGYFYEYSTEDIKLKKEDRFYIKYNREYSPCHFNIKAFNMKKSGFDGKEHALAYQLESLLSSTYRDDFILSTLYEAERQIYPLRNFKGAFLNCFFIIETVIQKFVNEKKIEKGISKTKLNEYKKEVTLSYMLNIELPMLLDDFSSDVRAFFGEIDGYRKVRNDIVHNEGSVSEKQAKGVKTATFNLIKLLNVKTVTTIMPLDKIKDIPAGVNYTVETK